MATADSAAEPRIAVIGDGAALQIDLGDESRRFHAIWLRDNAQDEATRSPGNGQRLITLLDIPADIAIASAERSSNGVRVRFDPGGHVTIFPWDWLLAHTYDRPPGTVASSSREAASLWGADLAEHLTSVEFASVREDRAALRDWLRSIGRYGIGRLRGVPVGDGAPERIVALFGHVRETNYGRVFDVRVEPDPVNLAYSDLGLQAHTDNPYRDPPPGLQILVCLQNGVDGGETLLVDGFEVARRLREEMPHGFDLLTRRTARFDYAGSAGVRLSARKPLIELGVDGELLAIRFNNRSAAPFVDIPYDEMADYYRAYRRMAELIDDPGLAIRFQLEPGDAVVIDNLRVLHGRTAITSSGGRHLQGCYADKDGLLSTLVALDQEACNDCRG